MSTYKTYPKYKPSGVEWLGEVPEGWEIAPFKWQIERNDGGVWGDDPDGKSDTIVLRSTEQTVDGHWKMDDPAPRKLSATEIATALLLENDLLVTKSSGSSLHIGKTTLVTREIQEMRCCYSNFMQRIRVAKSYVPKVAWYLMNNDLARLQFDLLSNSSTGLANLNGTMIGQIFVPIAPLPEQHQIASFLDRECGKLDALQAKQERLIELLKEKRQALISHAVTKGLDPTAKLKPSGIEWLGDVPEHWRASKVKWVSLTVKTGGTPSDPSWFTDEPDVPWLTPGDFSDECFKMAARRFVTQHAIATREAPLFPPSSVFVVGIGATLGKVARLDQRQPASSNQQINAIVPSKKIESDYLLYSLLAQTEQMKNCSNASTLGIMNQEKTKGIHLALPPLAEQRAIVAHLDEKCGKIDQLKAKAERGIELLKERRSALISAAVTGKIDVRHT